MMPPQEARCRGPLFLPGPARRGEYEDAQRMTARALKASQEAEYRIFKPYHELRTIHGDVESNPSDYLRHRLKRLEEYFGIQTHDDFRVPFEFLSPAGVAASQRVFIEASWNAVKLTRRPAASGSRPGRSAASLSCGSATTDAGSTSSSPRRPGAVLHATPRRGGRGRARRHLRPRAQHDHPAPLRQQVNYSNAFPPRSRASADRHRDRKAWPRRLALGL